MTPKRPEEGSFYPPWNREIEPVASEEASIAGRRVRLQSFARKYGAIFAGAAVAGPIVREAIHESEHEYFITDPHVWGTFILSEAAIALAARTYASVDARIQAWQDEQQNSPSP